MSILTRASSNNDCTALRDAQFSSKFINVYRVNENKKKKPQDTNSKARDQYRHQKNYKKDLPKKRS